MDALSPAPEWLAWTLAAWTLPFLWIATSMSVRRAIDAGWSPWIGFLVVLPVVNLFVALILALGKHHPPPPLPEDAFLEEEDVEEEEEATIPRAAVFSTVLGTAVGIGMVAFSTLVLRSYGSVLFVATPVGLGAVVGFVFNVGKPRSVGATLSVVWWSTFFAALALMAFALEGALCIVIIAPLVLVPSAFGAVIGRSIALSLQPERWRVERLRVSLVVLALPLLATAEAGRFTTASFEVRTSVEVDAPPEVVWEHVVSFSELPEPEGLLFRLGVAHPRRARIEGSGVGAVRRCEFSTGPFVEPITAWEPPTRLAFDVSAQPPPMHEWSPYRHLHPPHLDGYIRSRGGEFRLVRLPGGRTRLEGSTWYELDLFPQLYFRAWADAFIHRIHRQVLDHVKRLSEAR
jgi:hypothetical protein